MGMGWGGIDKSFNGHLPGAKYRTPPSYKPQRKSQHTFTVMAVVLSLHLHTFDQPGWTDAGGGAVAETLY